VGPGAKRDEPSESSRERILTAALEIFSERGFDGARTRDIAERAGANLGLIKYYFDTKETLWKASVDRAFEQLRESFGDILDPDPASNERQRLEGMIRRFIEFSARRPEFMRLMNDEGKRDGPRTRWLVKRHVRPMFERLRGLAEQAQASGVLPPLPPSSFQYLAVGAMGLVFSQAPEFKLLTGVDPMSDAYVQAHADAVVRLLLGSPAERTRKKPTRR